jgi:serine/threonine protein kinase
MIMEYCQGGELMKFIEEHGALKESEAHNVFT